MSSFGTDYHKEVNILLEKLAEEINKYENFKYTACVDTSFLIDKEICKVSGIGNYGKNSLLYNENDGSLKKVNPIDWTYFWTIDTPESAKGQASSKSQLFCRIESGMRNALSARRRGRVEALAILVHPTQNSTTLKLVAQKDAGKPLRGYALYRVDPITNENKKVGNTDLNGNFIVEPDSVSPLHILVIKNGNALLAKLPILPGSQSELTAPVMDDDLRLQAEGYLQGIEEEIVDQIVLREIAMARIEAKIAKSDKQAAHDLLNDIRKMKTRDDFLRDLESRKSRFFTKEPAQQARINQMFDKTMKLLGEYMSSKRIAELETKINSMP